MRGCAAAAEYAGACLVLFSPSPTPLFAVVSPAKGGRDVYDVMYIAEGTVSTPPERSNLLWRTL